MKLFVLTLALAVLTGSWAFVLRDEPDTRLHKLIEEAGRYMKHIRDTAVDKGMMIASTKLAEMLSIVTRDSFLNITKRWDNLKEELPTEVVEAVQLVERVDGQVVNKAFSTQRELENIMNTPMQRFIEALVSELSVSADPVLERLDPSIEALRHSLDTRTQAVESKLDEKLNQQLESLNTRLQPYIDKWPALQESLKPYVDDIQQWLRVGLETVHKHLLKSYIETILESAPIYEEELNKWAVAPVFPRNP